MFPSRQIDQDGKAVNECSNYNGTTPLNSLDRCDRCGAQAYVRAILISAANYYSAPTMPRVTQRG